MPPNQDKRNLDCSNSSLEHDLKKLYCLHTTFVCFDFHAAQIGADHCFGILFEEMALSRDGHHASGLDKGDLTRTSRTT